MIRPEDIAPHLGKISVFPEANRTPFYIVAPRYVRTSAGIKALHLLCHHLNSLGVPAFMVILPRAFTRQSTNPDWNTPLLTQAIADHHHAQGLTPVTVYAETVPGNPLHAPVVMRYVLNYPGLLGGDTHYAANEILYGYSKKLAEAVGVPDQVLFMPLSDAHLFTPPPEGSPRAGSCFSASKYQQVHGGKLLPITEGAVEITRDQPDSPTQAQIADLFRRSEFFFTYENTALIIEALLCGCTVVCLPNPHFMESIGADELGWDGIAWGDSPEEIARAKRTVSMARAHYLRLNDEYWLQLMHMANHCAQQAAAAKPRMLQLQSGWKDTFVAISKAAIHFYKQYGFVSLVTRIVRQFTYRA